MQLTAAMLAIMWAYNGWHAIAPVAEEVRRPERNIPLALFGGLGILIVLYVGANLAYHSVLSMSEMQASGENAAQHMIRELLLPSGAGAAQWGVAAMSAVIMCSTLGAINSHFLEAPRVAFAMGRDDVFFRGLGRVHPRFRTPAVSIIVLGLLSAVLVVGTAALVEAVPTLKQTQTGVFEFLTNLVVFSASLFYMLAVLALIVLRRRRPDWPRPYRTPGYPLVPLLYLAFYAWFLYYVYNGAPDSRFLANVGLALVALGVPVYFAWQAWAARTN
jgi:amino acid transporter